MSKERKCDVDMLAFLNAHGATCTVDAFVHKHGELYAKIKNHAIGDAVKKKLMLLDRAPLLNRVFTDIALLVPIKDRDVANAIKNELSDETVDVLANHMKESRGKGPSREVLSQLVGGDFDAQKHWYERAVAQLHLKAGQTAISNATHLAFDSQGRCAPDGRLYRAQPDSRWLELVLSTLDPTFKRVITSSLITHLSGLVGMQQADGTTVCEAIGIKFLQRLLDEGFRPEPMPSHATYRNRWEFFALSALNPHALIEPKKKKKYTDEIIREFEKVLPQAGPETKKWVREYKKQVKKRMMDEEEARKGQGGQSGKRARLA